MLGKVIVKMEKEVDLDYVQAGIDNLVKQIKAAKEMTDGERLKEWFGANIAPLEEAKKEKENYLKYLKTLRNK